MGLYNLSEHEAHSSLGAASVCFIGTWALEGIGEGKGELFVQSGQESLSTVVYKQITYLPTRFCKVYTHHLLLSIIFVLFSSLSLFSAPISSPVFPFSSSVLNEVIKRSGHFLFARLYPAQILSASSPGNKSLVRKAAAGISSRHKADVRYSCRAGFYSTSLLCTTRNHKSKRHFCCATYFPERTRDRLSTLVAFS
jgi:hypothetical protein